MGVFACGDPALARDQASHRTTTAHQSASATALIEALTAQARRDAELNVASSTPEPSAEGAWVELHLKPTLVHRAGRIELIAFAPSTYINETAASSAHRFDHYPMVEVTRRSVLDQSADALGVPVLRSTSNNVLIINRSEDTSYGYRPDPTAQGIADTTDLVIEGQLAKASNGALAACKAPVAAPVLDRPVDNFTSVCWVGLSITRIAYVNRSTGEVLRAWQADAAPSTVLDDDLAERQR